MYNFNEVWIESSYLRDTFVTVSLNSSPTRNGRQLLIRKLAADTRRFLPLSFDFPLFCRVEQKLFPLSVPRSGESVRNSNDSPQLERYRSTLYSACTNHVGRYLCLRPLTWNKMALNTYLLHISTCVRTSRCNNEQSSRTN